MVHSHTQSVARAMHAGQSLYLTIVLLDAAIVFSRAFEQVLHFMLFIKDQHDQMLLGIVQRWLAYGTFGIAFFMLSLYIWQQELA